MKISLSLFLLLLTSLVSAQIQDEKNLNILMEDWHKAAATADADAFFGKMAAEGVYIGTDATERWLRDELREWAKEAFERESAWTFKVKKRNWHQISADVVVADEILDTWMGDCRTTAVLKKVDGKWLIYHYQLSVTIPNEQIDDFKKLIEIK